MSSNLLCEKLFNRFLIILAKLINKKKIISDLILIIISWVIKMVSCKLVKVTINALGLVKNLYNKVV